VFVRYVRQVTTQLRGVRSHKGSQAQYDC